PAGRRAPRRDLGTRSTNSACPPRAGRSVSGGYVAQPGAGAPPGVGGADRPGALVVVAAPDGLDPLRGPIRDVASLEVVVDVVVAQPEFVLVGPAHVLVEQVGGGSLLPQLPRGAEVAQQ